MDSHFLIPIWIKILYTIMVGIIVPVYWKKYGPINFLWLSDIALFVMLFALWLENNLLSSMMILGVLPFEIFWLLDFMTGSKISLGGVAKYMFDSTRPLYLRLISLFHIPLLCSMIYMLFKFGYDPKAFFPQIVLLWLLFPLTYYLADPASENINWVFGLGEKPEQKKHPILYLLSLMLGITLLIYVPWHFLLLFFFKTS